MHYSPRPRRHELWKRRIECGVCGRSETIRYAKSHQAPVTWYTVQSGLGHWSECFRKHRYAIFQHRLYPFRIINVSINTTPLFQRDPIAEYESYVFSKAHLNCRRRGRWQSKILQQRVKQTTAMVTGKAAATTVPPCGTSA